MGTRRKEAWSETAEASLFSNHMMSDMNIKKILDILPIYKALRAFNVIQSSADTIWTVYFYLEYYLNL